MDLNRSLTVLADGQPVRGFRRARLTGRDSLGLFPQPFLLRLWNLSDEGYFALYAAKVITVFSGDAILAYGSVSDVCRRVISDGMLTEVIFSAGLPLWEAQVSLSVEAGVSVSETVRRILEASGTDIQILSFPEEDPVFSRSQAFYGRAAECICEALSAVSCRFYLNQSGLCVLPVSGQPVSMVLSEGILSDPVRLPGGRMLLRTELTGWPLGKTVSVQYGKETAEGLVLERSVDADNMEGKWEAELLLKLNV